MEDLKIQGTYRGAGAVVSGQSANGEWKKIQFAIDTIGQYPKVVAFELWNDKTNLVNDLKKGDSVTVHFNASSNFSDKSGMYFTSLQCWKIDKPVSVKQEVEDYPADDKKPLPF